MCLGQNHSSGQWKKTAFALDVLHEKWEQKELPLLAAAWDSAHLCFNFSRCFQAAARLIDVGEKYFCADFFFFCHMGLSEACRCGVWIRHFFLHIRKPVLLLNAWLERRVPARLIYWHGLAISKRSRYGLEKNESVRAECLGAAV